MSGTRYVETSRTPLLLARHNWNALRDRPLDRRDVDACARSRLLALLADAVGSHDLPITAEGRDHLNELVGAAARDAVALDSRCAAAIIALGERNISAVVLKGAAVSRLDYSRPGQRFYGDIDLLVRGADIHDAVGVLSEHGFARHYPQPFPGHDSRVGKGVSMEADGGVSIDLHRTLALGWYGTRLPVDALWATTVSLDLDGIPAFALGRAERFVHTALHGALSPVQRLADAVDLAVIGSGITDAPSIVDCAERWGCGAPVAQRVARAASELPGRLPVDVVEWARTRRRRTIEAIVDQAYRGPLSGSHVRTIAAVAGLRGWRIRWWATLGIARSEWSQLRS